MLKVVVDASVVASALLRPDGAIASVLISASSRIELVAPDHLLDELADHADDFATALEVPPEDVLKAIEAISRRIDRFIRTDEIPSVIRERSERIVSSIDVKDAAYVAVALAYDAVLWTFDRKLSQGLLRSRIHITIDTATMRALIEHS